MTNIYDALTSLEAHGKELPAGLTAEMKQKINRLVGPRAWCCQQILPPVLSADPTMVLSADPTTAVQTAVLACSFRGLWAGDVDMFLCISA
jgi:hypothetical protein